LDKLKQNGINLGNMGIKHLNKFLRENCKNSIKCISMSELSGKKIAIDISIYLYKYVGDDSLIENMYLMISIFRYYNITPIFIFDGKPPTEKKELLKQRRENKLDAEKEYNRLRDCLHEIADDSEKQEIIANMDSLKKQFVYVNKKHIELVKELLTSFGVNYFDAPGEADELCAMLVLKKKVWCCMSEDMDLFAYGCSRVLRYFSLINRTAILYDMKSILYELSVTMKEFRQICVLSGTDYNISYDGKDGMNLQKTTKVFKKYKKTKEDIDFYEWFRKNYPDCEDNYEILLSIYKLFDLSENHNHLKSYEDINICNSLIIKETLKSILENDGFIFAASG
jgi:flap endonuclease-1